MMSPITVRADVGPMAVVCEGKTEAAPAPMKKFPTAAMSPPEVKTFAGNNTRSGAVKVDAAFQALNEQAPVTRGVNHRPPHADETAAPRRDTRRNNSRNSNGRSSDESVRGNGRKSFESGRRSADGSANRKSNESQRSSTTDTLQNDDATDQLSQITDILLARLITTLSDSTLGNPALLLQTLLGFSPDDYNDLLAALSESRLSYVDIISAYLHNIKVMSEDSGSTSAALSGTLTRSLIEQYNSLLAQAVKSPQSIARANLTDTDGRSNLADMIQRATSNESKPERRSFESLPKGPSGLGFGRRHSADGKQRQQQQSLFPSDNKPATQPMLDASLLDLSKLLTSAPKVTVPDLTGNCSMAMPPQGGITQEQLAAFLQNAGMMPNSATQFVPQPAPQPSVVPSLPFLQQPGNNLNGMMAMNLTNPYAMLQQQPWTMPMQQPQMAGAGNRGVVGWQGATTVGFQQPGNLLRGWGGAGLETVPESFSTQLQVDPSCFALNMQPHGQQ